MRLLTVHVKPNARKSAVLEQAGDTMTLAIAAPPEDGKANAEVERFLSKLTKQTATIITGKTSKTKRVRLT